MFDHCDTALIEGGVDFVCLVPKEDFDEGLPLLLHQHGGGQDHTFLTIPEVRSMYERLWETGALPPMIVACYNARGGWHLNYKDGTERWEDFAFEFIELMQDRYGASAEPQHSYMFGVSMGAMGALRMALKYPGRFAAVAGLEGVINPVLDYADLQPRNYGIQHNLPPQEQARRWGWPVDRDYYHANNHATIARDNADAIRASDLKLYIECGDRDYYNAQDGAEFLHRVLWEHRIAHEYRLLQDVDHVGPSLLWRMEDAHRWIGRMAAPEAAVEPSPAQQDFVCRLYRGEVSEPPSASEAVPLLGGEAVLAHRRALPDFLADYADKPFDGVFRFRKDMPDE